MERVLAILDACETMLGRKRYDEISIDEIKRGCAGNFCRCGTYPHLFDAALEAGREMKGGR